MFKLPDGFKARADLLELHGQIAKIAASGHATFEQVAIKSDHVSRLPPGYTCRPDRMALHKAATMRSLQTGCDYLDAVRAIDGNGVAPAAAPAANWRANVTPKAAPRTAPAAPTAPAKPAAPPVTAPPARTVASPVAPADQHFRFMRSQGRILSGMVDERCITAAHIRGTLNDLAESASLLGVGNRPEVVAAMTQFKAKWAAVAADLSNKKG